jgi:hypothetical protein
MWTKAWQTTVGLIPSTPKQFKRVAWFVVGLGLLWGAWIGVGTRPLHAHGGGVVWVAGQATGPFLVTVWAAPDTVQAGETLHFTVAVIEAATNRPVLDAEVQIVVWDADRATAVLQSPATAEQATNKLFYEADFAVAPEPGNYWVETAVRAPLGEGQVAFELPIVPAQGSNWLFIGLGGLVVVASAIFFLSRRPSSSPTSRPVRAAQNRTNK